MGGRQPASTLFTSLALSHATSYFGEEGYWCYWWFLMITDEGRSSEYAWSSFGELLVAGAQVTLTVSQMFYLSHTRLHLPFPGFLVVVFFPSHNTAQRNGWINGPNGFTLNSWTPMQANMNCSKVVTITMFPMVRMATNTHWTTCCKWKIGTKVTCRIVLASLAKGESQD